MSRTTKIAIGILIVVVLFQIDYWNVRRKEKQLTSAVAAIGGRNGSIPAYPLGTEYRIVLNSVPDAKQLEDLQIANHLRGWVGIALEDCELSEEDVSRIKASLPACHLFLVDEKETTLQPLSATEPEAN